MGIRLYLQSPQHEDLRKWRTFDLDRRWESSQVGLSVSGDSEMPMVLIWGFVFSLPSVYDEIFVKTP